MVISDKCRKSPMILCLFFIIYTNGIKQKEGTVYILMWTKASEPPFNIMKMGHQSFKQRNCKYQNCFITDNKKYFHDVTNFHVVIFNAVTMAEGIKLPAKRLQTQMYIYVSTESPANFPITPQYNGFFNWTWTYRLDSDINFAYIVVRDKKGNVVAPNIDAHWMEVEDMKKTSKYIIKKLQRKNTAAAWFVSHCDTKGYRSRFVKRLIKELKKYQLNVHMFGKCGSLRCPKDHMEECYALIESDYYFYLSFENSLCEDYVTEKLLTALEHYAVPIVYGGANYSRFMPSGMYLNALELGPKELASVMNESIHDKRKYYNYFKWHNHYSFHDPNENNETDVVCGLCSFVNRVLRQNIVHVYENITQWWNEANYLVITPPTVTTSGELLDNLFAGLSDLISI